ncbi:FtsQ-type POTRA domain-containing protein [Candidatus Thioglobus sp.]|nr:FtsQ-type POTRA domain-containing protein [Candidatus Thioglobus sp.]
MAKERKNQLKKQKTPLLSVFKNLARKLAYLLLALSLFFVIYLIDRSNLLDPKISWEINNQLVASSNRYESLTNPLIKNKYLVNLNHIKEKVKESPWVSNAEVQRIFWNQIKVSIQEHDIAMRWGLAGYISSKGVLFKPNLTISSDAPIGLFSESNVLDSYFDFRQYQAILDPVKISIFKRTSIDELTLENNIKIILGHQKQNERLKIFIRSFEQLKKYEKIRTRGIFDMRYPNGFALSYSPL